MEQQLAQSIVSKLNGILTLMVLRMTEGKTQSEQIRLLSLAGMRPTEIAKALNTTSNTVNVALANLRKRGIAKLPRRNS